MNVLKKYLIYAFVLISPIFIVTGNAYGNELSSGAFSNKTQTIEKQKYNDNLVRELREVRKRYPLLSERLGLIHKFGRPLFLCIGGVEPSCHQAVQQQCIDSNTSKPDYQYCLDQANRVCCKPAVFKE
jgi:hypothetical protein